MRGREHCPIQSLRSLQWYSFTGYSQLPRLSALNLVALALPNSQNNIDRNTREQNSTIEQYQVVSSLSTYYDTSWQPFAAFMKYKIRNTSNTIQNKGFIINQYDLILNNVFFNIVCHDHNIVITTSPPT